MADRPNLIEQAVALRKRALTAEHVERRRLIDRRNERIQKLGVKAVDGVTFAKKGKGNSSD